MNRSNQQKKVLTIVILFVIAISFLLVNWSDNQLNGGGLVLLSAMLKAALLPDLTVIPSAIRAAVQTLAYATTGISLALVYGSLLSIFMSGAVTDSKLVMHISRNISAISRAIHELVWALFFVASIGLSPYAGIFAIAIPYGGMIGKVFSDILMAVDQHKIDSFRTLGASKWQLLFYVYLPEAFNQLVSYGLYRYECAIRSSTILSFVGLGGLGYMIKLTLDDLKFNQMFTYIYILILLIYILDKWGERFRLKLMSRRVSINVFSTALIVSWLYVYLVDGASLARVFNLKNLEYSLAFLGQMLGIGSELPAFLDLTKMGNALILVLETLQMSIISIALTAFFMFLTVVASTYRFGYQPVRGFLRLTYLVTRSIPELIWAMMVILILKPGVIAGAIALAIHNYGILSKLCAEVIDHLRSGPLSALRQTGANRFQLLVYGVWPMSMTRIISYIIYRWEIILRTTIVVGIVGAGGIGQYFRYSLSLFHYSDVALILICYLLLVKLADLTTGTIISVYQK